MPINIDMTLEGLGGIYPGNMFRLSYLPESYGQVNFSEGTPSATPATYFSIMGLTQTINQEGWQTKITAVTNKATIETSGNAEKMAATRETVLGVYKQYMNEWTEQGTIADIPEVPQQRGKLKGKEAYLPGPFYETDEDGLAGNED